MKTLLFFIFTIIVFNTNLSAQKAKKSDFKIDLGVGPSISLGWNLYSRYERPTYHEVSAVTGGNRSAGQVLNIMPSCRVGLVLSFDVSYMEGSLLWHDYFHLILEGGVDYMPFARDIDHYKGLGAFRVPISLSGQIPLGESALFNVGAGVQFSRMEFNKVPQAYKDFKNPFFITYFVELGLGAGELEGGILLDYQFFARIGLGTHQSTSLDIGVRGRFGAVM